MALYEQLEQNGKVMVGRILSNFKKFLSTTTYPQDVRVKSIRGSHSVGTHHYIQPLSKNVSGTTWVDVCTFSPGNFRAGLITIVAGGIHNNIGPYGVSKRISYTRILGDFTFVEIESLTFDAERDRRNQVRVIDAGSGQLKIQVQSSDSNSLRWRGLITITGDGANLAVDTQ